jgi:hypothetical protein
MRGLPPAFPVMDAPDSKDQSPADFNKLDLSQLQGFSFGTQWSQEKPGSSERGGGRGGSDDRRDAGAPDRRDRRGFRRPGPFPDSGPREGGRPAGGGGPEDRRSQGQGFRDPRGPRREFADRGPRGGGGFGGRPMPERGPYESPYFSATFYPEDTSFATLAQTIRKSCRTVELFEIARTVVAKNDRFIVVLAPRAAGERVAPGAESTPAVRPVVHVSVPDGLPFESDEAAVAHVLARHLDSFFTKAEVEVEPPKGNFLVINRCGLTGELLGPPNYHRYGQILQQHYAAKVGSRLPFEAFKNRIETVRDPEVVKQWLDKMRRTVRYTWKVAAPAPAAPPAEPVSESAPASADVAAPEAAAPVAEAPVVPSFDTLEDARLHLLTQARDKVVRTSESVRFKGQLIETLPPGEIRLAVEGALERQRRFPLDTANALRGRLRREHFTIFKKGSKGISYVCAVKRRFRVPGQTFADSIGALIAFIESNPMVRAGELPAKFLGITPVATPSPSEGPEAVPAGPSAEDRARVARLQGDLLWLVREGYVTEFIDGRLFAPPPMVEARKKEIEAEDHDPENFPEAAPAAAAAGEDASAQGESADSTPTEASPVESAPPSEETPPAAQA